MRVYVAGSWSRRKDAKQVGKDLETLGHTLTHKWWDVETDAAQEDPHASSEFAEMACTDLLAVDRADCVLVLATGRPRDVATYGADGAGTLVEMGAALGSGKPIVRMCIDGGMPPIRCIFDHLAVDAENFARVAELLADIEEYVIANEAEGIVAGSDHGEAQGTDGPVEDPAVEDGRNSSGFGPDANPTGAATR